MVSFNNEWCFEGAKEAQDEEDDGTVVILDAGCKKATRSRHAYHLVKRGLSEDQTELLPDSRTFNFANSQRPLASEKCRISLS